MLVSKLDAARRQLETAVDLYFSNKDPISIHTLTCAAYNILRDISSRISDTKMLIKDQIFAYIEPGYEKEVRKKINEAENFFKHADRDHNKNIEFHSGFTDFMLHDACNQYHMITQEAPPLLKLFSYWFMINYIDCLHLSTEQRQLCNQMIASGYKDRAKFKKEMLVEIMR